MNENEIKEALASIEPSLEAKAKMLENILASRADTPEITAGVPSAQKRVSKLKIALPLAACLIVLAGIGVFVGTSLNENSVSGEFAPASNQSFEDVQESVETPQQKQAPSDAELGGSADTDASADTDMAPLSAPLAETESSTLIEYPVIYLDAHTTLEIVELEVAERADAGSFLATVEAADATEISFITCEVFELKGSAESNDHLIISFENDPSYYRATVRERR